MTRLAASALALLLLAGAPALAQTPPAAPAADATPTVDAATAKTTLAAFIEDFRRGAPNYAAMDPKLAEAVKPQVEPIKGVLAQYGAVKSMSQTQIGPHGGYIFRVVFDNATTDWVIHFNADKKVDGLFFKPAEAAQ